MSPSTPHVCICVIGVGFVGASLLRKFGRVFHCIGYDISESRIGELKGDNSFHHLPVKLTSSASDLRQGTHFLIAVPTPVRQDCSVNLDYVVSALSTVFQHAKRGSSIIIESTVPIGTTRRLLGTSKNHFHCGMSPERIDPRRVEPSTARIPKIVSALTKEAREHIAFVYGHAFETIVQVSKPEAAEMTKLYENCYRMINIAYVNEISDACRMQGINPHEVIEAASTKPSGFQPFYPGIGVGGHCIPVNPYYLFVNNRLPILKKATHMMQHRPQKIAAKFLRRCAPRHSRSPSKDSNSPSPEGPPLRRILIVGMAFKPGQSDLFGSPTLTFARRLRESGCQRLAFYDPLIEEGQIPWLEKLHESRWKRAYLDAEFDSIAVCVKQQDIDLRVLRTMKKAFVWSFVSMDDQNCEYLFSSGVKSIESGTGLDIQSCQQASTQDLRKSQKEPVVSIQCHECEAVA